MSPDQQRMCFAIWRNAWAAIQESGEGARFAGDERAARMAITRKALGRELSWGDIGGQKPVDRLLMVLYAIVLSEDLDAQLRLLDQPFNRAEHSLYARVYLTAIGIEEHGREAYLDGIAKRIHKKLLCDLDDEEWQDVLGALNHTAMHKLGVKHKHRSKKKAEGTAVAGQNPASREAARLVSERQPF